MSRSPEPSCEPLSRLGLSSQVNSHSYFFSWCFNPLKLLLFNPALGYGIDKSLCLCACKLQAYRAIFGSYCSLDAARYNKQYKRLDYLPSTPNLSHLRKADWNALNLNIHLTSWLSERRLPGFTIITGLNIQIDHVPTTKQKYPTILSSILYL